MDSQNTPRITVTKDGPYLVKGSVPLSDQIIVTDGEGTSVGWEEGERYPEKESYALCRCGKSRHKPYCDGAHAAAHFHGEETASRRPYAERAERMEGPGVTLLDAEELCVSARHCHLGGGTWGLIGQSDDPEARELAIRGACNCPGGRLTAVDAASGEPIEPKLEPSLGLIQDPAGGVSGPIWVRGGIPVESADGTPYETRNRVALCRCGKSRNMPFCDASHVGIGFRDDK